MSGIRLIVGLGNPGAEYLKTRHNAGFLFVDALAHAAGERFSGASKLHGDACRMRLAGEQIWLLKPMTLMNNSGIAVASALRYYKIEPEQCLVVHDDLDLSPGTVRLKFDGGHGGQNGLRDIKQHLGHGRFYRLRIGIGHPGHRDAVTPWVLGKPSASDQDATLESIRDAADQLELMVSGRMEEAMKRLHTRQDSGLAARGPK